MTSEIHLVGFTKTYACGLWLAFLQVVFAFFMGYWTILVRIKNFDSSVLKGKFSEEFKKNGMKPAIKGYPDMGHGKFGCALPYRNWFNWNLAMRAHQNASENVVVSVMATLGNWYFCPYAGAIVGSLVFATRILYTLTYEFAPSKIELASRLNTFCIVTGLGLALYRSF